MNHIVRFKPLYTSSLKEIIIFCMFKFSKVKFSKVFFIITSGCVAEDINHHLNNSLKNLKNYALKKMLIILFSALYKTIDFETLRF